MTNGCPLRCYSIAVVDHFPAMVLQTSRLAFAQSSRYNPALACGGIAQLGERLHGMQEVSSSILLISTTKISAY